MTVENLTLAVAKRVCAVDFKDLDSDTRTMTKQLIADGVAVAIAGSLEEPPRILAQYAQDLSSAPRASVWGFGFKTHPAQAAFVNAASMHVLDFEPMSNPPTHAVSPTVPVAFALAEHLHANGAQILTACAKGFEMQGRVLIAADPKRGSLPFHAPGVIGVMGSTVAAAHLLGLAALPLSHALGIATSRCSGLSANTGSMVKCTHCGQVAAAGLEAATLAAKGFSANPDIFSAAHGYIATFFKDHFNEALLLDYANPHRCVDPGMAIKFYPSKYPTHFVIAAALEAHERRKAGSKITAIRIITPEITDANRPQPRLGLEGKFSFQYVAAAALLDGVIDIRTFTDERRFKPDMVDLLSKIKLEYDVSIPKDTRRMHVVVEVSLDNGEQIRCVCRKPPGTWGEPIPAALHQNKILDCLQLRLSANNASEVMDRLDQLETLDANEVVQLSALLSNSSMD